MPPATLPAATAPPDDPVRAALTDDVLRAQLLAQARAALRGCAADAEDAVQQVLARAWEKRAGFDPARGTVGGWLYGFAANVFREMFRSATRAPAQQANDPDAWEAAVTRPALEPDLADLRFRVERFLNELSADERAVVVLWCYDDLGLKQIAARLGVSHAAARQRFSRAVKRLRSLPAAQEDRS